MLSASFKIFCLKQKFLIVCQVICGFFRLLGLIFIIGQFRMYFQQARVTGNPILYFVLVNVSIAMCLQLTIFKIFWFQQDVLLNLINFIQNHIKILTPPFGEIQKVSSENDIQYSP